MAAGARLSESHANSQPDRAVYLDSKGNPQEVGLCFQRIPWAEPGAAIGAYVPSVRNVMVLTGTTCALAATLDQQIEERMAHGV